MAKECILSIGKLPLGGLLRNSVVRISDSPNITSDSCLPWMYNNKSNKHVN